MKTINKIALVLCIIGGLNWGLIGFFQFDAVAWIFGGQDSVLSRIIYAAVGVAAVWCISILFDEEKHPDAPSRNNHSEIHEITR